MSAKTKKTSFFTKEKYNNLTEKQCDVFIKDYKEYKNGKISKINNPKTNKQLNKADKIKYIYEKCKIKLGIDSVSPKSKSPESEDNEILLDSYKKVQNIIYIPLITLEKKKALIVSLFAKPIKYEEGLLKLYEYLNLEPQKTQNIYVKFYHNILREINKIIRIIYNYKTDSIMWLTKLYYWEPNYNYNPFAISKNISADNIYYWNLIFNFKPVAISENISASNIEASIKNSQLMLKLMWDNTSYSQINEVRCFGLYNQPIDELKKIILYSENNHNKDDVIRNLNDNMEKYIALQFILINIRDGLEALKNGMSIYNKIVILHLNILDSLITKDIVNTLFNNNNSISSVSVSKSISWSGTPRSSSSNHSHFQSKANIARYRKTKADLVAEIKSNNINDMDPYLAEKWEDIPLNKLKNVISLKYTEGGKTFGTAFYIRTLYQAWKNSVKDKKPFKNPYTRKNFTDNDKVDIMNAIILLYPTIQRPKFGEGRKDIAFNFVYIPNGIISINFNYIFKIKNENISVPIITIKIPSIFNVDVEPDYIQQYLLDNILRLNKTKKTFGKNTLLKPLPVLLEYNGKTLYDYYSEYKVFFDKIKNAL